MTINLLKIPNQIIPFFYEGFEFELKLRQFRGALFATVSVNGEVIVASRRVVAGENILGYDYLTNEYGTLTVNSKYNSPVTDYSTYGDAVYLVYEPPE